MSEHTPGPWESAWNHPPQADDGLGGEWGIRNADGTVVIGTFYYDGLHLLMREEDATLISAAPDLLEALVMVRDADEDCALDGLPRIPGAARARIDAAIAKATGKDAA